MPDEIDDPGKSTAVDKAALMGLLGQLAGSPAMRKMAELDALAKQHGLDPASVELLVPVLCRFIISHQAIGKLQEATEFAARVMASAADFGPELAEVLEKIK
jgi:hypothetical protein